MFGSYMIHSCISRFKSFITNRTFISFSIIPTICGHMKIQSVFLNKFFAAYWTKMDFVFMDSWNMVLQTGGSCVFRFTNFAFMFSFLFRIFMLWRFVFCKFRFVIFDLILWCKLAKLTWLFQLLRLSVHPYVRASIRMSEN